MMVIETLKSELIELFVPIIIFGIVCVIGLVIRKIVFSRLSAFARSTVSSVDDIIVAALRTPFVLWCVMFGLYAAVQFAHLPDRTVGIIEKVLFALGVLSVSSVFANIGANFIAMHGRRLHTTLAVTSFTQNIVRIVVFCIGILIVLNSLGISIAPLLATLGVGGLAVALALQDTLSNLFAGFHVIAAKQVKVGDYIKLDTKDEGYVMDINWRTTKIRMPSRNVILVPNSKLSQAIVTNYCLPTPELVFTLNFNVHYRSDLEKVQRLTEEVAKDVMMNVPGAIQSFEPVVRFSDFSDFSIIVSVVLGAQEFSDQSLVKHEFIKRLHSRYNLEGIIIPFPIRAINQEQEQRAAGFKNG